MTGYEGRCPSCGATVVFHLGRSLLKVCDHCGVAVARQGADLQSYGKVAALLPTPSVLKLGLRGGYTGAPRFTLVGRLQPDYGAGRWDEWLMGFDDGTWAWLSESQGRFHYMGAAALPPLPAFSEVRVGQTHDLGAAGTFVVTEVRKARFAAAEGELPFAVAPGSELHYADLSGPGGQFATADYGTGDTAEALYVGREVTLPEMGFKAADLPGEEERRKTVGGEALKCPQCAGPVEVKAPDHTQRIACPYCGSLLDATAGFAVLEVLDRADLQPVLPLGGQGRLEGATWTLIGAMERSVTVEGVRYPWQEYLLYEPHKGFRWLVLAKGHWSWVETAHAGDVVGTSYRDLTFAHFQGGRARVDHVLGEFYWAVARGDETDTQDYVNPPHMLSKEEDDSEVNWSFGTYKTPEEVWSAFGLEGRPPEPEGVAPHQPSPTAGRVARAFRIAFALAGAVVFIHLASAVLGGRQLHRQTVQVEPRAEPGSPEAAVFAGPLFVTDRGNLQVRVNAPVNNSWLYLDGALINEETGAVDEFDLEVAYYHGSDSDGSWSEGGSQSAAYLPAVEPGRYTLRLQPLWEAGRTPPEYEVTVRSRVPRFYKAILAILAIMVWPLVLAWRHMRFEIARWSESDHPWVESSSGDEEDDE